MSNELAVRENDNGHGDLIPSGPALLPTQHELAVLQTMAKAAGETRHGKTLGGYVGVFSIFLLARELGIMPMHALNGGLHNIEGKIEISARQMNALIRSRGHVLRTIESTSKKCTMFGKRIDNGEEETATFEIQEAIEAGIVKPSSNWKKWAVDMCYARAVSRLARRLFADVIGPCYIEGEISGAMEPTQGSKSSTDKQQEPAPQEGEIVDAEFTETPEISDEEWDKALKDAEATIGNYAFQALIEKYGDRATVLEKLEGCKKYHKAMQSVVDKYGDNVVAGFIGELQRAGVLPDRVAFWKGAVDRDDQTRIWKYITTSIAFAEGKDGADPKALLKEWGYEEPGEKADQAGEPHRPDTKEGEKSAEGDEGDSTGAPADSGGDTPGVDLE